MLSNLNGTFICSIFSTDLYLMSDILSFSSFENISCTLLFIRDDSIAEGMEVLHIVLLKPADLDRRIRVDSTPAEVLIVDNDGSSASVFSSFNLITISVCLFFPPSSDRNVCRVQFSNIYSI